MNKPDFESILLYTGWTRDRWGHYKKARKRDGQIFRMKIGKRKVRLEVKSESGWVRLGSGFYSRITYSGGRINGLKKDY